MRALVRLALIATLLFAAPMGRAQETDAERQDRGTITAFLEDNLSGAGRQVILRDFKGALSSRATASQMTIADDDGIWLTLNDIVLDWNRAALLSGKVSINELTVDQVIVARKPRTSATVPAPEAGGFSLPELPVSVMIDKIAANQVLLEQPVMGQAFTGTVAASLTLAGGEGKTTLTIRRTDDGPGADVVLAAEYRAADRSLALDLSAREAAGGIAATLLDLPGAPSVDLTVQGAGPLEDFAADLTLETDGQDRLSGRVTLLGGQDGARRFSADFSGDVAPLFLPDYADFFGPDIALRAEGVREASGRVALSALDLSARSVRLSGQLSLAPNGMPEAFALTGDLADPSGAMVLIPGSGTRVGLQSAALDLGYDQRTGETWSAKITGQGLETSDGAVGGFYLKGSGRIAQVAGGQGIGGTLTSGLTDLRPMDAALAEALGPNLEFGTRFWWTAASQELRLAGLSLTAGDLSLTGSGAISQPTKGLEVSGQANLMAASMVRFSSLVGQPLSGSGAISLRGRGNVLGGDFDAQLGIDGQDLAISLAEVDGLLRGASRLTLDVLRDQTGVQVRTFDVTTPTITAQGNGRITSTAANLALDFDLPDLSALGSRYSGTARGEARLDGPLLQRQARIDARFTGENLGFGQAELDRLLRGTTQLTVQADLAGDAVQIEALTLDAPGATARLQGRLAASGSDLSARVDLGNLAQVLPGFAGRIGADITASGTPEAARVTLAADATGLRVGQPDLDRLLTGSSRLSGAVRLDQGNIRIEDLSLATSALDLTAKARAPGGGRDLDLVARLSNLGLLLPDFPGPVTVQGWALEDASGYGVDLTGTGPGAINGRISGRVDGNFRRLNLRIDGTGQAGLANPFIGQRIISGPLTIALQVNGPPALRSVSGRVALANGRLADPSLPFTIQDISAGIDLSGGQARINAQSAISTGGTIDVDGTVGLSAPYSSDLQIGLVSVVVRDPQLYETRANGTLTLSGPITGGGLISGRIALPETELRIAPTGLGAGGDLPGLRHVNEPAAVRTTRQRAGLLNDGAGQAASGGRPFGLDILISAPNRQFIRGRGLDAELGGELRITGTSADVVPTGAFNLIRGRLDILGRRLLLTEAQLQLEGDFDPFLTVAASTVSDGITASVRIEGSASNPQVSFTSSPELPEEEVLAQLLFGRRLETLSAFQAVQLANAVATLAGRGGDGLVNRLRQGIGLDDLDVQTNANGEAQLTAGKYLSENIYSEVVVDQTGKSQINLNLDLSDSLTIKGGVGAAGNTGIGLFFKKDY
jgi:translocation and assembly module TamB